MDETYCSWEQSLAGIEDPLVEREAFYRGALHFADLRGWLPGWAFHAYQARYGEDELPEPEWEVDGPVRPTPEHLAWMREYYNEYRRSKKKSRRKRLPANVVDLASRRTPEDAA